MKESNFIKTIQTIAIVLMMGVTTVVAVMFAMTNVDMYFNFDVEGEEMLFYAFVLFAITMFSSKYIYKTILKDVTEKDLKGKKSAYQTAVIASLAVLEGGALFAVTQLTSGNLAYLVIAALALVLMLISFPTGNKFEMDAQLTKEEIKELGL